MSWFSELEASVQAAAVIGVVTLLGTIINFISNYLNNRHNSFMKRYERVLDKRSDSIQEILSTLSRFYEESSNDLFRFWEANCKLQAAYEESIDSGLLTTSVVEAIKVLKDHVEDIHEHALNRTRWFDKDMGRLTVWLQQPEKIRRKLERLKDEHRQATTIMTMYFDEGAKVVETVQEGIEKRTEDDKAATKLRLSEYVSSIRDHTSVTRSGLLNTTTEVSQELIRLLR